jgi:hypothetical protein
MKRHPYTIGRAARAAALLLAAVGLCAGAAEASFSGTLYSSDLGLIATGNWNTGAGTIFDWVVSQNPDNSWHYHYRIEHPAGATSHFILEVSSNFTRDDIFNATGNFGSIDIKTQLPHQGNPFMPEGLYGIRFEEMTGVVSTIDFDSWRVPVWGDFFAVNGAGGGDAAGTLPRPPVMSTARNAGFTANDWDPVAPPQDDSIANHILVPDTITEVPEPSTLMLLGGALFGAYVLRRKLG